MFNGIDLIVIRSCLVKEKTDIQNKFNELISKATNSSINDCALELLEQAATIEEVIQKVDKLMSKCGED